MSGFDRQAIQDEIAVESPPLADPITFSESCCGKCHFGTCYVDQMTGA